MLSTLTVVWRQHRVDIIIGLGVFFLALLPRVIDLGTFLTADEKNWIGRSYEFVRAVKDWRFNDTLQTTHPGVTTLWASGVAIVARVFTTNTPFSSQNLAHFAAAAQLPVALMTSLAVPAAYFLLRRLLVFSRAVPLLAALFMALNPFLVGYSRVVHVDALTASFMIVAALAMLIHAASGFRRGWLIAAAVLSGFAILTKAPAVFLLPFLVLVWVFTPTPPHMRGYSPFVRGSKYFIDRGRDLLLWLIIVGLMFVVLWPAMLFVPDPKGNALLIKRDLVTAGLTPHHMVEDYTLNTWHYPLTLLTRATPVTLVFAGIAVVWVLFKIPMTIRQLADQIPNKPQFLNDQNRKMAWLLVGYVFFFIVMMTLVAKKGDRYIMPVFPALDILAAFGILSLRRFIGRWALGLGVLAGVFLATTVWNYHPYTIAYSNPLFPDNLSQELGWGEGLEQVAAWLNEHDPKAIVASWYPEELGAFTSAQVAHINAHEQTKVRYIVLYRNMFGRAPDHYANDFIDEYYKKREPVFTAYVAGKEFAWVYDKWTFERVVGELVPGMRLAQQLEVSRDDVAGVDVMIATYSGKATAGTLIVNLISRNSTPAQALHTWKVPVAEIKDDVWLRLKLPEALDIAGQSVEVEITAEGTAVGNAPTVRYTRERDYRPGTWQLNGADQVGDLAARLRYSISENQEATEEETRLLEAAE